MTVTVFKGGKMSGKTVSMLKELNEKHGTLICFSRREWSGMMWCCDNYYPNVDVKFVLDYEPPAFPYPQNTAIGLDLAEFRVADMYITEFEFPGDADNLADLEKEYEKTRRLKVWSNDED